MGSTAEFSTGNEGYTQGEGEAVRVNQWQSGRELELRGDKETRTLLEEDRVGIRT